MTIDYTIVALLIIAGFFAGAINAVAGGGPLITLPLLIFTGIDARVANLTSTVALLPGQLATGYAARDGLRRTGGIGTGLLIAISIAGGAVGAILLLTTPSTVFAGLVPWLVLAATAIYAWSNFGSAWVDEGQVGMQRPIGPVGFAAAQTASAIYGGYFGGGNSFVMLALLTVAGLAVRDAGQLKNLLISLINMAAAGVFLLSSAVAYDKAIPLGLGAIGGSLAGAALLHRMNERILKIIVVAIGVGLTLWLFRSA
jgi:uncharacterized membrane protein YfcA